MKLNGWFQLGIVLSLFWVFGSILYTRNEQLASAARANVTSINLCVEMAKAARDDCLKAAQAKYTMEVKTDWYELLLLAVFPVFYAWVAVLFLVWVGRQLMAFYRNMK